MPSLTLFFTAGVGLKTWAELGMLDREVVLYKKLSSHLKEVNFVTYGGREDKNYAERLGPVKLLPVRWSRWPQLTTLHLLLKHFPAIRETDILKTNQISGVEVPLWLKEKLGKKLIVRCGYLHSQFTQRQTKNREEIEKAIQLEKKAFLAADIGIVTTPRDRDDVIRAYGVNRAKIKVIPNYVVTDIFKPHSRAGKKYDLVFVGRADKQKNIDGLLKALRYLKTKGRNVSLLMVGNCCHDSQVKELIKKFALNVALKGNVPHFDLPELLNQARIFILPSYYEGHPKVLLEAMSCGLPCIGTDVIGIRGEIEPLRTGYLCQTDDKSLAKAIEKVLTDKPLQKKLARNARQYVLARYRLDKILKMELEVIRRTIRDRS